MAVLYASRCHRLVYGSLPSGTYIQTMKAFRATLPPTHTYRSAVALFARHLRNAKRHGVMDARLVAALLSGRND